MATDATGEAPGLWVKRVGRGERPPRARTAMPGRLAERRPNEEAPVADRDAERLQWTGGAGGWARRVVRGGRVEAPATEALCVAAGPAAAEVAASEKTERTAGATSGDRQVASAPVKREAERLTVSAKPVRANALGGQRAHGRSMVRFGDPREEQRARVEAAR